MTYIFLIINSSASRTPTIFPVKFLVLSNGVSIVTENTHRSKESVQNLAIEIKHEYKYRPRSSKSIRLM